MAVTFVGYPLEQLLICWKTLADAGLCRAAHVAQNGGGYGAAGDGGSTGVKVVGGSEQRISVVALLAAKPGQRPG
jgi:hypothetical protein